MTLRYLKTGATYQDIGFKFRAAKCTVCKIVSETVQIINDEYFDELVSVPTTATEWKRMADNWEKETQFPHCLGALDGTHIPISRPKDDDDPLPPGQAVDGQEGTGSKYYCWKQFYSVVILALVDANFKVIWCLVGASGKQSDAGLFLECNLRTAF